MNMLESFVKQGILSQLDFEKLIDLNNERAISIIEKFVNICKPEKLMVISDSQEDIDYVKTKVVEINEELMLDTNGHTVHYDGFVNMEYHDQARDKEHTQVLIPLAYRFSFWY